MKQRQIHRYTLTALLFAVAILATPALSGWLPAEIMPEPPMSNSAETSPHYDSGNSRLLFEGDMPDMGIYYTDYSGSSWSTPSYINLYLTSSGDMRPAHPFVTSDSQRMYLSSVTMYSPTEDLYFSDYSGSWGTPTLISSISNDSCHDSGPSLDETNNVLYFASISRTGGVGEWDIWASTWTGSDWGTPELVNVNSASGEVDPFYYDGTLYFASNRSGGYGRWDIWAADGSGTTFGTPYNLGANVNTEDMEKGPSIAPDTFPGSSFVTILFDSYRDDSNFGDIYTSENDPTGIKAASLGEIKATFK